MGAWHWLKLICDTSSSEDESWFSLRRPFIYFSLFHSGISTGALYILYQNTNAYMPCRHHPLTRLVYLARRLLINFVHVPSALAVPCRITHNSVAVSTLRRFITKQRDSSFCFHNEYKTIINANNMIFIRCINLSLLEVIFFHPNRRLYRSTYRSTQDRFLPSHTLLCHQKKKKTAAVK